MRLKHDKKKITLDEIRKNYKIEDYSILVEFVMGYLESGELNPIKSSRTNGKNPALYNAYRIVEPKIDDRQQRDYLNFKLNPRLSSNYYLKNMSKFMEDQVYVVKLSQYLDEKSEMLEVPVSYNERSYEIWGQEKFLNLRGHRLLRNLGLRAEDLNIYETTEPLAYYSQHKNTPQSILIIENKDTFYSMRRHLMAGNQTILGVEIGSLIYGKGKAIFASFKDFSFCVEPYMTHGDNRMLYFGDIDYEGILIYESLAQAFEEELQITPFVNGYRAMLKKAKGQALQQMKLGQNKNIGTKFLDAFIKEERIRIKALLDKNEYIPQEILVSIDFEEGI